MSDRYLYRGINSELYESMAGKLLPKLIGEPFEREVYFGEKLFYSSGAVFGRSERNAVLMHQQDSSKYKTSGVSMTPNYENAVKYATHNGKHSSGFVYKIDATLLNEYGIKACKVSEHVTIPAIPDDEEIILVASDNGALPVRIIVEVCEI